MLIYMKLTKRNVRPASYNICNILPCIAMIIYAGKRSNITHNSDNNNKNKNARTRRRTTNT
jgi:hypothetical protein